MRKTRSRDNIRDDAEIIPRLAQVNAFALFLYSFPRFRFPRRSLSSFHTLRRVSVVVPSSCSKFGIEASFVFAAVFTSRRQELRCDAPACSRAHSTMIILLYGSMSVTDVPLAQPVYCFRLVKVQEPGKGCVNIRIV